MNERDSLLCRQEEKMIVVQHNLSVKVNGIPLGLNGKEREVKRHEKR